MDTTDITYYKSAVVSDAGSNGGREGYSAIVDAVMNNLFPNVSATERANGVTRLRKLFLHNKNASDETFYSVLLFLKIISPAEDRFLLIEGTQTDVQSDIGAGDKRYGCGTLKTAVSAGATSVVVVTENGDVDFADGDKLYIGDKPSIGSGSGNEEYAEIDTSGVSWSGNEATLTLTAGLAHDYPADTTYIANCLEAGDIKTSFDNWAETSSSGTYDETTYPPELENWGTVEDTWTLTFSDASNFSVVGTNEGSVGSGSISSDFSPTNSNTSSPYFTLKSAGWGGTWANGDTIVFKTHPASKAIWIEEIVPAGAASYHQNNTVLRYYGE